MSVSNGVLSCVGIYKDGTYIQNKKVYHITSYDIPNNITRLYDHCFYGCSNLSSITIPDSVMSLGTSCFLQCSNLTSITIPDSVMSLGTSCFQSCHNLSSVTLGNSVSELSQQCFYDCSNLSSITIPNSVSKLRTYCFYGCSNLSSIVIPDSVTKLGNNCFEQCRNLNSITIPNSVSSLDSWCFKECNNLKTIYTNNPLVKPSSYGIPSDCKILPYEESPDLKPIEIEPIEINLPQIIDNHNPDLLEFNEYIKERSNLIETVHVKSEIKYHESIIDITEELNENIKLKQLEIDEYIKILQDYKNNLSEISSNLTKK